MLSALRVRFCNGRAKVGLSGLPGDTGMVVGVLSPAGISGAGRCAPTRRVRRSQLPRLNRPVQAIFDKDKSCLVPVQPQKTVLLRRVPGTLGLTPNPIPDGLCTVPAAGSRRESIRDPKSLRSAHNWFDKAAIRGVKGSKEQPARQRKRRLNPHGSGLGGYRNPGPLLVHSEKAGEWSQVAV